MMNHKPERPSYGMQIRRIIFERFNDIEKPFNNDEILDLLNSEHKDLTTQDIEDEIAEIRRCGMVREIGQNFTTVWLKLFDILDEIRCASCDMTIHLGRSEERICPNPSCGGAPDGTLGE